MTENPWLSPEELADLIGIPLATIYQWRHKSYGPPAAKIGRHLRYSREVVEGWMAAQTSASSVPQDAA